MAYEEEQAKRSRVVVDTPRSGREVVHSEAVRTPERSSSVSGAMLAVVVIGAIALATVIILFAMNQQQQDNLNANTAQTAPPQTIVQQPAQQPPVIVQQPAPAGQPPVIINQPASGSTSTSNASNDSTIQAAIDKKLGNDPVLSTLGVTATVMDGKATLIGTVKTQAQKAQFERAVRNVKGVKSVDNQIIVDAR